MDIVRNLRVNGFKQIEETPKFNENFIKSYNEDSEEKYFLKVFVQYPEKLRNLLNVLLFLRKRMKIKKVNEFVANLHDKREYVIQISNLKQALYHWLVFRKWHRAIKFYQKARLEPYIDMNTELRKMERMVLKNIFFKS